MTLRGETSWGSTGACVHQKNCLLLCFLARAVGELSLTDVAQASVASQADRFAQYLHSAKCYTSTFLRVAM